MGSDFFKLFLSFKFSETKKWLLAEEEPLAAVVVLLAEDAFPEDADPPRNALLAVRENLFAVPERKFGMGQKKSDLMKNKRGKIVSKKANAAGKRNYKRNGLGKWTKAFVQARKNLKIKGFVPCKKGTAFYKECMKLYKA